MLSSEPFTSGRDLALRMNAAYPHRDWVALLAERAGKSRDFVEWHLQEDMAPPEALSRAASELLDEIAASNQSELDSNHDFQKS
ncbi:hypothetical protein [Bosea sp. TAF32]|uniref:hypothetical protein n=1 Tax=Bosea sp. TAF32 TaxID=3237482 RepID=UPI003F90FD23